MLDYHNLILSCAELSEFSHAYSTVCRALPREIALKVKAVVIQQFGMYGTEEAFQRMKNKTVAELLALSPGEPKPVASGEVNGVRYILFDAPSQSDESDS
jgi:hypothetical protein